MEDKIIIQNIIENIIKNSDLTFYSIGTLTNENVKYFIISNNEKSIGTMVLKDDNITISNFRMDVECSYFEKSTEASRPIKNIKYDLFDPDPETFNNIIATLKQLT